MLLCPECRKRTMYYVSYESTSPEPQHKEACGYWICNDCGHVIYNFRQRPLVVYGEKRSGSLLEEAKNEIEKVRKWMRDKDAPPEIMKLFERTRKRCVWTFD